MAEAEQQAESNGGGSSGATDMIMSALKSKELLVPAALSAAGALVATKGPGLFHKITDAAEEKSEEQAQDLGQKAAEGAKQGLTSGKGGIAGKAVSKILPGGGGGGGGGGKKTRRLPIQRWTDVAVSVEQAYEAWLNFDEFPKFMHRVLSVRKEGDDKVRWQEKIWFSKRDWEGRITERRKNDRIAWKTTSGMSHYGVVTFHRLDDNLTRVMVDMEFEPTGMMEKMASGLRFVKRAVQADLARFKAYVEMKDAKGIDYRSSSEEKEKQDGAQQERGGGDPHEGDDRRAERQQRREQRRSAA